MSEPTTTPERRVAQIPVDQTEISMLTAFAGIGCMIVNAAQLQARGDPATAAKARAVGVETMEYAVGQFARGFYTWDLWRAFNLRLKKLAMAAFPDAQHMVRGDLADGRRVEAEYPAPATRPDAGGAPVQGRRTLADEWRQFERQVLDPMNAGAVQRKETRRAFYGGARVMFTLMTGDLDPGSEPTPNDLAYMDQLQAELQQYLVDLREGRA